MWLWDKFADDCTKNLKKVGETCRFWTIGDYFVHVLLMYNKYTKTFTNG